MDTAALSTHTLDCELLRVCAAYEPDAAAVALVRKLAPQVDWDYCTHEALRHGLVPMLYRNLNRTCSDLVPQQVLSRLGQIYIGNAAHNLRLTGELLRILSLFEDAGLRALPFKGPALADLLFGNVSLRQFGDLDILVRQEDVRKAKQLLLADGYLPEFILNEKAEAEYIRSEHAFQFHKKATGFVIEVHWRFGSRNQVFPIDPKDVWSRVEHRDFQNREIPGLAREDLLLYLCVHGAKHGWERLEWISCVAQLVRLPGSLDWEAVAQRAGRSGAERALHVGLLLSRQITSIAVPEAISRAMFLDAPACALAEQTLTRLFTDEPEHSKREVYRQTFYLRSRERWFDRARILFYFSARVPHPLAKDWSLFKVPASMSFLYYLLRPMRLMREYGFRRLRAMLRPDTSF